MSTGTILVVEDDQDLRELMRLYLEKNGLQVYCAENGEQSLHLLRQKQPDVIVMDVMLPDANGVDLCQSIREFCQTPIIFVSRMREADDIIKGLELGGDDYMTKPFDPNILVARVKAHLRRAALAKQQGDQSADQRFFRYKGLEIDLHGYEVKLDGEPVALYAKELQLLLFLVQHPNQVFSFQQLLDQVWGYDHARDERTVMVQISNLRKKIERDPTNPRYIQTVRGFGYKFHIE
ncbi:MAG: response regulator [Clostridia bacterium]